MFLLFDIGGTKLRVAYSHDGKIIADFKISKTPADFNEGVATIIKLAREVAGSSSLRAVAGGIAGPLDQDKTMVVSAPNLPGWNTQPLKSKLEEEFKVPVYLENDTAMIGLGEAIAGAGQGFDIVAYLTVSTGVGGTRIVSGRIDRSVQGFEPGHQIININSSIVCTCGARGHLEGLISGSAIKRRFGRDPKNITNPQIWEEAVKFLAAGLNNVLVHWSPSVVILGGPMMKSLPIKQVEVNLRGMVKIFSELPPLIPAALGELGGLHGALAYLRQIPS